MPVYTSLGYTMVVMSRVIQLNKAQQEAVDTIHGPLMVLAGPGTGKTQLLSSRVAKILQSDNSPSSILCLTFTEAGAHNMRTRLAELIGEDAYSIQISTYHSFGSEIIKSYPEFFNKIELDRAEDTRLERPIDDLQKIQIVGDIVAKLAYGDPLLSARYYIKDVVSTISDLKKELITPDKLRTIATSNLEQIQAAQGVIDQAINDQGGFVRGKKAIAQYGQLLEGLADLKGDLIEQATTTLSQAYIEATSEDSTPSLTAWKGTGSSAWLYKDDSDSFTLTNPAASEKMLSMATIYERYQTALKQKGLYDFDDMILRAIEGVNTHNELRYNLQERYQYILLDEFQDTNAAQFELVRLIADHPSHEGRPNIMAVGDDDQAIFAFQGAEANNMLDFIKSFRDTKVISLDQNYRSDQDILYAAAEVGGQIDNRLHINLDGVDKTLQANHKSATKNSLYRIEAQSQASEYAWVGTQINHLLKQGVNPSEIAILAPRHRFLEALLPFLASSDIPLSYEKRENVLETPIIEGLKQQSELLLALGNNNTAAINELMPVVLSHPAWGLKVQDIWEVNWQLNEKDTPNNWVQLALDNRQLEPWAAYFLQLSSQISTTPLENVLDILMGAQEIVVNGAPVTSPLKEYYFSDSKRSVDTLEYYESLSHLSLIRSKLREQQSMQDSNLGVPDFLAIFDMYQQAESPLINSHPLNTNSHAVQLMTAFKAKGLEFEHVFIISAIDQAWGPSARDNNSKVSLPINLRHIRFVRKDEDELRRLLYVAMTRPKDTLYISSHMQTESGKSTSPIKYLRETEDAIGVFPSGNQDKEGLELPAAQLNQAQETYWFDRHVRLDANLKDLLAPRLNRYKMSPTHLGGFVDTTYGGPQAFLLGTLLRFPQAPSVPGEYGTAIHNCLEWYQGSCTSDQTPTRKDIDKYFKDEVNRRYLSTKDKEDVLARGLKALHAYIAARTDMFSGLAVTEVNFSSEGASLGEAMLSGKIDRIDIDKKNKIVHIADYKTGKPYQKWGSELNLYKYELQLYFYKILIENSYTYKDYTVGSARLEFVEPNSKGKIVPPLYIEFDDKREEEIKQLVQKVWSLIQKLELPDISDYSQDLKGTKQFVKDLFKD